eukprot:Seg5010.2 transcript_id=Seg5010.2/GoldUCD/mRNA.D3Y31 product="hypothetical protein" protein_id=Seg5010.2/GoldUCD/D3Y31
MASPEENEWDTDRGMRRGSPEQEILFLLFGSAAETAYNNLPGSTNYSSLGPDFWIAVTNGRVGKYDDWVKRGILEMATDMTAKMSKEEAETLWKRLVVLIRRGLNERKENKMDHRHKHVAKHWEELLTKVVQWMDENAIAQPGEEQV